MHTTPVYIVRHDESHAASINKFATTPKSFGDGGIIGAPKPVPVDLGPNPFIISSPKQRCLMTSLLLKPTGADLIHNGLDERDCGRYNDITFKSKEEYINAVIEIETTDQVGGEGDWETCEQMLKRLLEVIELVRTIKNASSIVLVTHWHPINVLINHFNNQFIGLHHYIKPFSFHKIDINAEIIPVNAYVGVPFAGYCMKGIDHEEMYKTSEQFPGTFECYESEGVLYAELTRRRIARPLSTTFHQQSIEIGLEAFVHKWKFVALIGAQEGYGKDAPVQPYPFQVEDGTVVQDAKILSFGKGWNMEPGVPAYLVMTNDPSLIRRVATKLKQDRWTEIISPSDELNKRPYSITYTRIGVTD